MSILNCDQCGAYIDTDDHPEAYHERLDMWLCPGCCNDLEEDEEDDDGTI